MKKYLLISISVLLIFASCKKGGGDNPGNNKKIASMVVNLRNIVFTYDAQGRLQRLDNGVDASTRFEHSAAGIVMQQYDASGNLLPGGRWQLNVVNGRVSTAKEIVQGDGNGVIRNHTYQYDGQGRLIRHSAREVYEATNEESRTIQYVYTYNGNNASHATYLHTHGGDTHASDSVSMDFTYYDGKKLYTYADIGFNYFGTVPVGMQHQGHGVPSPMNRLIPIFYFPANNPLRSANRKFYRWNVAQNKWLLDITQNSDTSESEYEYDAQGYLTKCGAASEIKWQ